jgi:hypothetical protein
VWGIYVSGLVVNWGCVVCGLMVNWGWVWGIYWSGFVVNWGWVGFVYWCWSWFVYRFWEGLVSWGRVGFVSWGRVGLVCRFVFWVSGYSFVFDIGNIAFWTSSVGDDLDTAIGKVYTVFSLGIVVFSVFAVRKDWSIIGIIDTVLVVVYWCNIGVCFWSTIWSWSMVWSWGCWRSNSACCHSDSGYEDLSIEMKHKIRLTRVMLILVTISITKDVLFITY